MAELQEADDVINFSQAFAIVLRRRWIVLAAGVLTFSATVLITWTTRPIFEASALLLIEKERGAGGIYNNQTAVESKNEDYYQTQYQLLRSYTLASKVADALQKDGQKEYSDPSAVDGLLTSIAVLPVPRSRLVSIRASSADPKLAVKIANTFADLFVAENLTNQLFISKEVLQSLQVDPNSKGAQQMYASLPQVVGNQMIQGLRTQLAKAESEYAQTAQRLTPRHPTMLSLQSNMDALRAQIKLETVNAVQSLKIELSGQLKGNNVRVVDPAREPRFPSKPNKRAALLLAVLGGLFVGLVLGYIVELLDQSVRSQEDVESRLKLPFLGVVPNQTKLSDPVYASLTAVEPSLTGESFRNLRTMVNFAGIEAKSKQLLVTSSIQEEGKSYIASNLAVACAQNGESVLLIDGDLRRPKLHKNFRLSSKHGLSDFLAKGTQVDELAPLVQRAEIQNLGVLVCGTRPPNPSELLNTPRMGALIAWACDRYDRVIIDCPPIFPINDTLLWGRHAKAAIFICRFGSTRIPLIRDACRKLTTAGIELLGVAINAAKMGGLTYSGYGYYYHAYYHQYAEQTKTARTA